MRHPLWLLSAFTVAATLALGTPDAEARKAPKSPKPMGVSEAYKINTKDCQFPLIEPAKKWDWKTARLTAQFIKTDDGHRTEILPDHKNITEKLPMASIAKLMTALVVFDAIDHQKLDPKQMINVSRASMCLNDNYFAVVGLPAGIKEISVSNAITHTLKKSSNTMAINLAIATAGSESAFVALMNAKAKEWGMNNTHFVNPHGLPEGDRKSEYTTAKDMLIMAEHVLAQFSRFKDYSHAPLKPWMLPEKASDHPAKQQLSSLGAVFKTGTIKQCASLLTMVEIGDTRIVDIELCGGTQSRFQNALTVVKGGLKRFGEMVFTPAMAADKPPTIQPINVSSRPVQPSDP